MRAAWLELHDRFEGVGAHELNARYDHVDGDDWDTALRELAELDRRKTPALFAAQRLLAALAIPVRFDGADLSHHQDDAGPIDWPTLRAASVGSWVATKATQSTLYVDPTCDPHRAQMTAQGFTYRGLYHWLSSTTDPAAQAAHFLNCVNVLHVGEFAMLDAEEGGITAAKCLSWLHAVEAVTHRPCSVYTGAYVAGGTIWQSTEIRHSIYGPRPMHLAAYTTEAKAKALPGVAAYPWSAWQYSSNGPVPGVTGRCDMNRIDIAAHYDLAAGIVADPAPHPPQGDDMGAIRLMIPTNDPNGAQFYAECFGGPDATGQPSVALSCRWTGDGGDPKVKGAIAAHKGAGMTDYPVKVVDFANIALDGPLPPGWTPDQFRNPQEIRDRDQVPNPSDLEPRVARLETVTVALDDSVGRLGQNQAGAARELEQAAQALAGGG